MRAAFKREEEQEKCRENLDSHTSMKAVLLPYCVLLQVKRSLCWDLQEPFGSVKLAPNASGRLGCTCLDGSPLEMDQLATA